MMNRCVFLVFLTLILSCSSDHKKSDAKNVFRYNESKGITSLDPAYARNQTVIWPVTQIFNGLVQMDNDLNVVPSIAHSWEISDNGKVYTFYLRTDVRFHNHPAFPDSTGRILTAKDFEYSFSRILDPSVASPGRWVFSWLSQGIASAPQGFEAINDSVFRIYLEKAFPPFEGILTMPYCFAVPHEVVEKLGKEFSRQPVGTGPFRFKVWREDEKLLLLRNEHYFEIDSLGNQLPYLHAVSISFIKDKQSEFLEFLNGNIDFLSGVHPSYKDELLSRSGLLNPEYEDKYKIISGPYLNTEYLGFLSDSNLSIVQESILNNLNLRKAINFGFNRSKMMKYMRNNLGDPAINGFVPPGLPGYDVSQIHGYNYNPDSAEYYLTKAGFPRGEGLGEIVLTTTSDYTDLSEFIQYELSRIGIKLRMDIATGGSFRNKVANSNLMFFRGSWIADYPDPENFLSVFYSPNFSPNGPNYTHFSNPRFDSLYEKSVQTIDFDERISLYQEMDQIVIDNAIVVPLYYDRVIRFVPIDIEGLASNSLNLLVLKNVYKK